MEFRRRDMVLAALAAPLAQIAHASALGSARRIPQKPSARVIVDNDFAGDPDGLLALAHQLLTPKTRVPLVTVSPLSPKMMGHVPAGQSVAIGATVTHEMLALIGGSSLPVVAKGGEQPDDPALPPSDAARAIVAEAMRDDPMPLFCTCGGPLTNVAAALKLEPAIASRMTVIWIGGGRYPGGGWEYNLMTDMSAARHVIEQSKVPLWQIPQNAYRLMQFSIAELTDRMRPISPLGAWLYEKFTSPPDFVDLGGTWPLGDSPLVLLTALTDESSASRNVPAQAILPDGRYGAPVPGRELRVFDTLDARLTFEDFLSLLRLHG